MWTKVARIILINRLAILIILGLVTLFMGWKATNVKPTFKMAQLLPDDDPTLVDFNEFKKKFGNEGSAMFIGLKDSNLFELKNLQAWYDLGEDILNNEEYGADMVDSVFSITTLYNIEKDEDERKFVSKSIFNGRPKTQEDCDSLKEVIYNLPFYDGLLFKRDKHVHLMALTMNQKIVNTKNRDENVFDIYARAEQFSEETGIELHYSGMPYIRTKVSTKIKGEMKLFTLLALGVTALILFFFLKSFKAVLFSLLVVLVAVVWSVGLMGILDYEITILTSLIPPLIIVIGIPNCIFLLNKYFSEHKSHGNKAKALTRVIHKIGNATLMTNITTAVGFATFIFTESEIMIEFGVIAAVNILGVFLLSILIIPISYSYLPSPKEKHVKHLDRKWMNKIIHFLERIVLHHRRKIYFVSIALTIISFFGLTKILTTGNVVDDLPNDSPIMVDLKFFESNFNGVIPFEIIVQSNSKGSAMGTKNLKKLDKLYGVLERHPEFSKPISIIDVLKFSKQAYYNGNPKYYSLPTTGLINEQTLIYGYAKNSDGNNDELMNKFIDSTKSTVRVSVQIADIGTLEMDKLMLTLHKEIDSIFNPAQPWRDSLMWLSSQIVHNNDSTQWLEREARYEKKRDKGYDVTATGSSLVYVEGTRYLVKNLITSLGIAIFLIAVFMAVMFRSWRMVIISLVPNLLPLLITGAIMGYAGIPIKPSTILVFSIAFGISVDDTIHFLAKYRQELVARDWKIKESAIHALRETGVSMFYTSVILFFGFGIFTFSGFGGTQALGMLVSITLLIAMKANLVLLPTLLLTLDKILTQKTLKEPLIEIFDEEEDIDLDELEVKKEI